MSRSPNTLLIAATVDIDLKAARAKGPPTFSMLAYTGAPMRIEGFPDPVILDLAGIKARRPQLPALLDHNEEQIVGQGELHASAQGVTFAGVITGDDPPAHKVVTHAKNGFQWQASVGAKVIRRRYLRAGQAAVVNRRTVVGPLDIWIESLVHEVSFVGMGADVGTSATIAAKAKELHMPNEPAEIIDDTNPITDDAERPPATPSRRRAPTGSPAVLRAKMVSEYMKAHPDSADEFEQLEARASDEDWSPDQLELSLIRTARPKPPVNGQHRDHGGRASRDTLEASLMLRAGHAELAVKAFGQNTVDTAERMRINSMEQLCRAALAIDPHPGAQDWSRESTDRMIRAAFSTTSLANILSNVMGRTLELAYSESLVDINSFATIKSAANFKAQSAIRPSSIASLDELGNAGEITHSDIKQEDTYAWQIDTYAKMIAITRTNIVNDDLHFFDSLPGLMAVAAARSLLDLFWGTIIANAGSHFHADNNNLLTTGSALAITSLATGIRTFREQVDSRGHNIAIPPRVLCVSPTNETTARALLNSTEIVAVTATTTPNGNPVKGIVDKLIVEPRLSNTDKFSSADAASWYLFGGPQSSAVLIGYLNGQTRPTVETADAEFNTLGPQMRCYHDFGVALGDEKAGLKATGAA